MSDQVVNMVYLLILNIWIYITSIESPDKKPSNETKKTNFRTYFTCFYHKYHLQSNLTMNAGSTQGHTD